MTTVDEMLAGFCAQADTLRKALLARGFDLSGHSYYISFSMGARVLELSQYHRSFLQVLRDHAPLRESIESPLTDLVGMIFGLPVRLRRLMPDHQISLWSNASMREMDTGKTPWPLRLMPAEDLN